MTIAGYRLVVNPPRGPLGWWVLLPIGAATVGVLWWAAIGTKLSLADFVKGMPWVWDFLSRMLPPNLGYMQNLVRPAVESVQIALWGTLLGVALADRFGLGATLIGCGLFWLLGATSFWLWPVRVPDTV